MLIDLNMDPSPQDDFIVAQDRSFLKPRWSGKSGTSQIVSLEHAKASAANRLSSSRHSRSDLRGSTLALLANDASVLSEARHARTSACDDNALRDTEAPHRRQAHGA